MSEFHLMPMVDKLDRLGDLSENDTNTLLALKHRMERVVAGRQLVREGDVPSECSVLIDGFACRYKSTSEGKRQIVSFHVPGDILDLQHLMLPKADHSVAAITSAIVAWIPYRELLAALRDRPALNVALWRDALIDASIFREWVLNVGRRDARARIAHMLCEFSSRMKAARIGLGDRFSLPMSQEAIADATGLTVVHVNRTLRALRADGVIGGAGREIIVTDWDRLQEEADFDPAYLHQAAA